MNKIFYKLQIAVLSTILILLLFGCQKPGSKKILYLQSTVNDIVFSGSYIWGIDSTNSKLLKINPETGEIVFSTIILEKDPRCISFHNGEFWVACGTGKIAVINDLGDFKNSRDLPDFNLGQLNITGLTWLGNRLFILSGSYIFELYPETLQIRNKMDLPLRIYGAMSNNGKDLLIINSTGSVLMVDPDWGYVTGERKFKITGIPYGIDKTEEYYIITIPAGKRIHFIK
ncbi:MAG: hypothetical protein PHV06_07460 [bacterium]|nr:hypothetical protein [bacterium]